MKLVTLFVARTKNNLVKIITDSESTTKINVRSGWILSLILLTSKGYHLDQYHYKKPL